MNREASEALLEETAALSPQARSVYRRLIDSTGHPRGAGIPRRRPALTLDGTPVVFSIDITGGEQHCVPRVLVEPGALTLCVSEQLVWSRTVLDDLCLSLGWGCAEGLVGPTWDRVIPASSELANSLWGGALLGAAPAGHESEVRVYLNLRHGDVRSRWQRVADALCVHADESLVDPFRRLVERTGRRGTPVGLGCVLRSGRLSGLRCYAGLAEPASETIIDACALAVDPPRDELEFLCGTFHESFGAFRSQAVTVSHDFRLDAAGLLRAEPVRYKIDVSCQLLAADRGHVLAWLDRLVGAWDLQPEPLEQLVDRLDEFFGGAAVDYVSVSFVPEAAKATVYLKPAHAGRLAA